MSVYVDDMRARVGRMIFCHCWADTRDELFAMMDLIGVQRRWFQRPPGTGLPGMDASWEHFDIVLSKRALAVRAGAIETDRYGPIMHTARLRGNWQMVDRVKMIRATMMGNDMARMKDLTDVEDLEVRRDNEGEYSIAFANGTMETVNGQEREKWYWLPRSEIEVHPDGVVTMPRWLAMDRGLI